MNQADRRFVSPFLARKANEEQEIIFDLARRTALQLDEWISRFPFVRSIRSIPLALTNAAAAPFCQAEELEAVARSSLWIFAMDDLSDEGSISIESFRSRVELYKNISLEGKREESDNDDPYVDALQDVVKGLSRYSKFISLRGHWAQSIGWNLDGMVREYEWRFAWRDVKVLPSYEDYLDNGRRSIGGMQHFFSMLTVLGDSPALGRMEQLWPLVLAVCDCLRLANDLGSFEKELEEGGVNSVLIVRAEGGGSLDDAKHRVKSIMSEKLLFCKDWLARHQSSETGRIERSMVDLASFVCDFYMVSDYNQSIDL